MSPPAPSAEKPQFTPPHRRREFGGPNLETSDPEESKGPNWKHRASQSQDLEHLFSEAVGFAFWMGLPWPPLPPRPCSLEIPGSHYPPSTNGWVTENSSPEKEKSCREKASEHWHLGIPGWKCTQRNLWCKKPCSLAILPKSFFVSLPPTRHTWEK